ncbi:MAG: hypothetical protein WD716_13420 [Fimbriimonadaceae bacterium]
MKPEDQARMDALIAEVESVRNLRPKTFELATDFGADIKARWEAFDELYEAIREGLRKKRLSPDHVLTTPPSSAMANLPALTEAQLDRSRRLVVALQLLLAKYGTADNVQADVFIQAEALVPTPPDPDTGRPGLTLKDQALLNVLTNLLRTEMTEDWECFFKGDSEPAAKRKLAFRRIYAVVGKGWMDESLFPRALTPEQRQWWVIFAMMCHVPGDQWGDEDLKQLQADLLPIEEPDWDDQTLFGP